MIKNMTHADYLSDPAYGSSDIIKMSRSFAYWKFRKDNPEPKGRPLVLGSATHLLLQAELTHDKALSANGIIVYQDGSSLTKGFKVFQETYKNLYCLDQEENKLASRMVKAILDTPAAMEYLKDAVPEMSVLSKFPGTNVNVKCRPDYLHEKKGVSINIKTALEASESSFLYSARDFGIDFQSAFYCEILSKEFNKPFDEIHIVVEKTEEGEPGIVEVLSFGDDTIFTARGNVRKIIEQIPQCEKTGIWPGHEARLKVIEMPIHMRRFVD